ncbi:ISAs1 family transposase [Catalinimonas niigatensis]|uniref:ISAs1 family transposase n=1 Tax=Catalinimonas niigatensis TaxID=1397264 RepID=UPI002665173D|nr:ISAs1 family transposase [Catalinimonas niigatensis]WPP52818.1 ISAs1 family transposase [Catalinimonas niigatensis]
METVENLLFDSRINRCRKHKLESIVLIVICATLKRVYGYQNISEFTKRHSKVLEKYIDLSNGCPSTVTLWRNFERINIRELIEYIELKKDFLKVLISFSSDDEEYNNTIKNRKIKGQSNLEIIRSHINKNYIHIRDQEENLLNRLSRQRSMNNILENVVTKNSIIAVASKCNSPYTAHLIKKKHGDYLLEVNKSNRYLFEQIKDQLDRHIECAKKKEEWYPFQEGTSLKLRRCYCLENQIKWIEGIETWPQVKSMIAIEEKCCNSKGYKSSVNYYLCSIKELSIEKIYKLTEYHFLEPYSWIISFEINCISKTKTTTQKILKSNLMWIQNKKFEMDRVAKPRKKDSSLSQIL